MSDKYVDKWIFSQDGDEYYIEELFENKEKAALGYFKSEEFEQDGYVGRIIIGNSIAKSVSEWCANGIIEHIEQFTAENSVIPVEDDTDFTSKAAQKLMSDISQAIHRYLKSSDLPQYCYEVDDITEISIDTEEKKESDAKINYESSSTPSVPSIKIPPPLRGNSLRSLIWR